MNFKNVMVSAALVISVGVVHSSAAIITSYNRATFQTALAGGTVSGQNFDALANGSTLGTLNGVTYGASLGTPLVTDVYLTTTNPNGLGSTSIGYFEGIETASFTFATPITAFGVDVNTYAPTAGDYTATLSTGDVVTSKFDVFPGTSTGQFLGFISNTPFTSVIITSLTDPNTSRYSYTLDSLVYGSSAAIVAVGSPEPNTLGALGFGLALLALNARQRFLSNKA